MGQYMYLQAVKRQYCQHKHFRFGDLFMKHATQFFKFS